MDMITTRIGSSNFNTMEYDSGAEAEMDPIAIVKAERLIYVMSEDDEVDVLYVEFYDNWSIEWGREGMYFCSLEIDGIITMGNDDDTEVSYVVNTETFEMTFWDVEIKEGDRITFTINYGPKESSEGWTYSFQWNTPDVELISPKNGKTVDDSKVKLKFKVDDEDVYQLTYSLFLDTSPILIQRYWISDCIAYDVEVDDQNEICFCMDNLEEGETYYWVVVVYDGFGCEGVGGVWSFEVEDSFIPGFEAITGVIAISFAIILSSWKQLEKKKGDYTGGAAGLPPGLRISGCCRGCCIYDHMFKAEK